MPQQQEQPQQQDQEGWPPGVVCVPVKVIARKLSVGKNMIYKLIAEDGLPAIRFGRAVRIPIAEFTAWYEEYKRLQWPW